MKNWPIRSTRCLVLIATVAMLAAGCGSDDEDTNGGTTAADTAATADTAAADDTTGGGTDATADDTASAAVCTPEQVTNTNVDACKNADDGKIFGDMAADAELAKAFREKLTSCVLAGCAGKIADDPAGAAACTTNCILEDFPISCGCGGCYGWHGNCGFAACLNPCGIAKDDVKCDECMAANCDGPKNTCTGI